MWIKKTKIMELKELINLPNATIVDVREVWEFNMGHIEGAVNIPLSEVYSRVDDLREMPRPIIVVCASGNRSGQATLLLRELGLQEVYNGGGWQEAGNLKVHNFI